MKTLRNLSIFMLAASLLVVGNNPVNAANVETTFLLSSTNGDVTIAISNPELAECKTVNDRTELAGINIELEKTNDALTKLNKSIDSAKDQLVKSRLALNTTTNSTEKSALSNAISKLAAAILTLTTSRQKLEDLATELNSKKKQISEKLSSVSLSGDSYEICTVNINVSWAKAKGNFDQEEMKRFSEMEISIGSESENHQMNKFANQVTLMPFKSSEAEGSFNGDIKVLKEYLDDFSIGLSSESVASNFRIAGGVIPHFTSESRKSSSSKSIALKPSHKPSFGLVYDASSELWLDPANRDNQGKCKFGFIEDDFENTCIQEAWVFANENDGFSKWISLSIASAEDEFSTGDQSRLEITCTRKKLAVNVYFEFPDSFGWKGSGQFRIDNGSGKKFTYTVDKSISYIWVDSPKVLTSSIMKSKEKVSFRLVNSYARILAFPKSDLSNWASKFKSAGCPLS